MTERFILTLGTNEGYFHNNSNKMLSTEVGILFNEIVQEYYDKHNIYVSFSISDNKTFYSNQWGCPESGEDTVVISGVCNTSFVDLEVWKKAVIELTKKIKIKLKQTTCTLEFIKCELIYFSEDKYE